MNSMGDKTLFMDRIFTDILDDLSQRIREEVENWDSSEILLVNESDIIDYLGKKHHLDPPKIFQDKINIGEPKDTTIDVSEDILYGIFHRHLGEPIYIKGIYINIYVPYEGDSNLFYCQPSTFTLNPPKGRICGSNFIFTIHGMNLVDQEVRQEIDSNLENVEQHLKRISNDCDQWNNRTAENIARECIIQRKQKLRERKRMVESLGLPIRRQDDTPTITHNPVTRRKRPVTPPPTLQEAFKPEPALEDKEYEFILKILTRLAISIERSPNTFSQMEEEAIRDILLVDLNGHYEGQATGETFNSEGKTDILIRVDGWNALIAECKFWTGAKGLHKAIDQILGYLTWRDTKAALLIFSKNAEFTNVLTQIAASLPQHPHFKKELKRISNTHVHYLFSQKNDTQREIYLAVLAFNIPQKPGAKQTAE